MTRLPRNTCLLPPRPTPLTFLVELDRVTGEIDEYLRQLAQQSEFLYRQSLMAQHRPDTKTQILDTAEGFAGLGDRVVKKVPLLRGKTVMNLFFEPSTP